MAFKRKWQLPLWLFMQIMWVSGSILTWSSMWDIGVCHQRSPPSVATLMTWKILSLLKVSYLRSLSPRSSSTLNWWNQLVHHCSDFASRSAFDWTPQNNCKLDRIWNERSENYLKSNNSMWLRKITYLRGRLLNSLVEESFA